MRKLYNTTETLYAENGDAFYLDYYILQKAVCVDGQTVIRFGLEIDKRAVRKDGTKYIEYRKVFDVFKTEGEALQAVELLARNTVTPISLKDVLEDLVGCAEFTEEVFLAEVG